jgi:hypothetical protein
VSGPLAGPSAQSQLLHLPAVIVVMLKTGFARSAQLRRGRAETVGEAILDWWQIEDDEIRMPLSVRPQSLVVKKGLPLNVDSCGV